MFAGIARERDPALIKLESDIFGKLIEVGVEEDKRVGFVQTPPRTSLTAALSFEDALKELAEIKKGFNIKHE
jgi:hypothetical protein